MEGMPLNNFNNSRKLIACQQIIPCLEPEETVQNTHVVAERLKLVNFYKSGKSGLYSNMFF